MRLKYLIAVGIFALGLCSCDREELSTHFIESEHPAGNCSLVLNFGGPVSAITKAGEAAAEGDKINNIRVWLVDNISNKVAGYASSLEAIAPNPVMEIHTAGGSTDTFTGRTTDSVTGIINELSIGEYTLYALANAPTIAGLDWNSYTVGATVNDNFKKATAVLGAAQLEPSFTEGAGMPLSLVKPVTITSGSNEVNGELLRICARLVVKLSNNTAASDHLNLVITKISFNQRNADKTYVFSDGVTVPSYGTRDFEIYSNMVAPISTISRGNTEKLYDQFIFETGNSLGSLTMLITGAVVKNDRTPIVSEDVPTSLSSAVYPRNVVNGTDYLIKNNAVNLYLKSNDAATQVVGDIPSDINTLLLSNDIDKYIWRVSDKEARGGASGSYTHQFKLLNIGVNKYLSIPTSDDNQNIGLDSNKASVAYIKTDNDNVLYYRNETYRFYQMRRDGNEVKTKRSKSSPKESDKQKTSDFQWTFYPIIKGTPGGIVTNAEEDFFERPVDITYTDEYSVEHPLTSIWRNSVVEILINVYYSPESRDFTFSIENWTNHDYETTMD